MISASQVCGSFKQEAMLAIHNLMTDTFYMALYDSTANLGPGTTAYTTVSEVNGIGYTPGGQSLTGPQVLLDPATNYAYATFNDAVWNNSVIVARAALIYNQSKQQRAVCVINFNTDRISNQGPFHVVMPPVGPTTALIRIY
jgi:hypothetical protein